MAHTFMKSAPGSTYEKAYKNNLHEDSFHFNFDQAIHKLSEGEEALLVNWYRMRRDKRFCDLEEIWTHDFGHTSIALTKNLPYRRIMSHALNNFIQKGAFKRSYLKWKTQSPSCLGSLINDLGLHKVVFLFLILLFGITLAFVILFHERRCNDCYKSKLPEVKFKIEMNLNAEEIQKLIDILQGANNQRHKQLLRELQLMDSRL